jgi:pantothenate kinase
MLARRGAHFTFDAESFRRFVISLSSADSSIAFPTFSHAAKDPVEGGHITPGNRVMWVDPYSRSSNRKPN